MTNEEVFQEILGTFGTSWTARFCKMKVHELRFNYEGDTYAPDDITYDIQFWLDKEQYMLDVVTNELLGNGR